MEVGCLLIDDDMEQLVDMKLGKIKWWTRLFLFGRLFRLERVVGHVWATRHTAAPRHSR